MKPFLKVLILVLNGLVATQSKKFVINLLVVHVGLSELLKLWVIDYVSLQGNKTKPEFQLKTYLLVVVSHVVSVVMVVSPVELGVTSRKLVLLLVIFMDKNNGVVLIHSLHAIIILMDHMDHVEHLNPHLNVSRVAHLNQNVHTLLIFIMQSTLIPLVTVNLLFRVKSFLLDLLK